jgi:Ser-tRNA(Ala) deacylase AlaX
VTRKVYWEDPYRTVLETTVTEALGDEVSVAATIFYPFAGGQEPDSGTIGGRTVCAVRRDGRELRYTLDDATGLTAGDPVEIRIDWDRRYRLMRLHFAAELVLVSVTRALPAIEKIGAHIAADKARIDFAWPENIAAALPSIATQLQALIAADHPIVSAFSDAAAERRYWEIAGFARVACGGTHIRRTGEIGGVDLRRRNIGGGKERIEITLRP